MTVWHCLANRKASSSLALVLVTVFALPSCTKSAEPPAPAAATAGSPADATAKPTLDAVTLSDDEMRTGGIAVDVPRSEARVTDFSAPAILQTNDARTARVGSLVDGVVVDTPVQVGARVREGQRIASIHSHTVHEAWADYRRAVAERRRATTELAFVTAAEGRAARLLAAKAASRQEAERARTDRAAAEEALVIAESEVLRALDELRHLGIQSESEAGSTSASHGPGDSVPVTATLGGVVLERLVTAGTAVTTGTPLFVISDLSRLWAIAELDEARLPSVTVGREATLTVTAYPDRVFSGRIIATGESVNPETRRVTARIEVANVDGSLKPQMFATVRLSAGEERQVLLVPAAAVQKVDQQPIVFVEERPGRFIRRSVTPGPERDGMIEIHDGLESDDRIATTGTFLLKSKILQAGLAE